MEAPHSGSYFPTARLGGAARTVLPIAVHRLLSFLFYTLWSLCDRCENTTECRIIVIQNRCVPVILMFRIKG